LSSLHRLGFLGYKATRLDSRSGFANRNTRHSIDYIRTARHGFAASLGVALPELGALALAFGLLRRELLHLNSLFFFHPLLSPDLGLLLNNSGCVVPQFLVHLIEEVSVDLQLPRSD